MVQRGMSALFECKVKHDPSLTPTMTWLKDNGELPDHERYGSHEAVLGVLVGVGVEFTITSRWVARFLVGADTLTIADVTEDDEGTYTCMQNTSLDMDSASAMLTVVGTFTLGFLPSGIS